MSCAPQAPKGPKNIILAESLHGLLVHKVLSYNRSSYDIVCSIYDGIQLRKEGLYDGSACGAVFVCIPLKTLTYASDFIALATS